MSSLLLDTDILINLLRGREAARDFVARSLDDYDLLCSAISVAEIWAGMKPHEEKATRQLLDSLKVIDVTRVIAEYAGTYKGSTKSHSLELDDCLIAATARAEHAVLATGNGKHYPMKDIKKIIVKMA